MVEEARIIEYWIADRRFRINKLEATELTNDLTSSHVCITIDIQNRRDSMLSVRLDKNTEKSLTAMASAANTTKAALIRDAIRQYIEDKTDYLLAAQSMEKVQKTFSLEDVLREFKDEL
jgi:predicted DNA-binding protein